MKCKNLLAVVISLSLVATAHAEFLSLRDYVETVVNPAGYPGQMGNELWQFRIADGAGTGALLNTSGSYYYYPPHPNDVPLAGLLYDVGEGSPVASSFDAVSVHPGVVPLAVVLAIEDNNTTIQGFRVLVDMVDNGFASGGIGLQLYTNINSVASVASSRVTWDHASTTPNAAEFIFHLGQTFNAGDRVEFYIDSNGGETYDQAVMDIQFVPEPASLGLLVAGGLLLVRRH